ncbi:Alpha/Beta hydrolase protein [Truncatella angustata]|uniref:Alpha/Beta hydrolase protein n=1 Tax=Truncatella angustata TaxID=152316 RepID=A0A9P9A2K3_9PEZI|nr:Alpha/Beta hydrolase protein [Truncatella angustata]KAH6659208.1 Alpha/Beta hydrolase protein [Truncatella angustata]
MKLTYYPAQASPNGTGVLVVPGGGYGYVSLEKEGISPAAWLNERGFDAWTLEYTTTDTDAPPIYPKPMNEALDAVRQIRREGRVAKLGIWGWSAGGHLAAITITNAEAQLDFAILAYPVISMEPETTHLGSLHNLLGHDAGAGLRKSMSAENRVSQHTPPVFIFHTGNDAAVPVMNALLFASALASHGCAFQILVLPDGPHGIGLALDDPKLSWTGELDRWLKTFVTAP